MLALLLPLLVIFNVLVSYFRNPLRRIPAAHPLAPFTSLWMHSVRWRGIESRTLKAAHARLGPIICLGPKEVSVNCVQGGIRDVYAGGFEKGDGKWNWYSFFGNYGGINNMFSTGGNKPHAGRKRMLSNIYSKSVVTASPVLLAQLSSIIYERFLPCLDATLSGENAGVLDIYSFLSASTMDIVTGYIFGLKASSNLIRDSKQLVWFLDLYNSRRSFNFWPQEFPELTGLLEKWLKYRLVPKWVGEANNEIETWTKKMCDSAAGVLLADEAKAEDTPVVYQQLQAALAKEAKKTGVVETQSTMLIASEVLDHLAAGFDTSGITLTYVVHELSQHKDIQSRLQRELRTLSPRLIRQSSPTLPDQKTIDMLPFLHAVIWETLRLHSAIPGPQPRITPPQGCRLGPEGQSYDVPGGVRVSASAGLLHLNEHVYEQAIEWRPERWLEMEKFADERRKDMESRWFWAFGSGGRMCVGSHLAVCRKCESSFLVEIDRIERNAASLFQTLVESGNCSRSRSASHVFGSPSLIDWSVIYG
ncbi:cytochrome P450 monooxygenase-like protein [Dothidotthia symphoricarpi CBS 119687]|uniref:Cytochrome P450 monooxygenase-like protein n=1 Tax=Dothidotthia symphoricarpi CBS 119687 TaxID=1392245 RepID=A0A6A6AIZ9_9PLEO|nr:cytochrome P450 monooxygenase-like protein [Dothidotthia symphoricarpi CBS 119687]KAF2130411.1 cytochrome P450 monooxygenase-like protein [Dothidotthia symphoricarpi CBS 119687]